MLIHFSEINRAQLSVRDDLHRLFQTRTDAQGSGKIIGGAER